MVTSSDAINDRPSAYASNFRHRFSSNSSPRRASRYPRSPSTPSPSIPPGNSARVSTGRFPRSSAGPRQPVHTPQTPTRSHRTSGGTPRNSRCSGATLRAWRRVCSPSFASSSGKSGTFAGGAGMFARRPLHHPVASLHGTGAAIRRILGQEHRHRKQPPAPNSVASSIRTQSSGPPKGVGIP